MEILIAACAATFVFVPAADAILNNMNLETRGYVVVSLGTLLALGLAACSAIELIYGAM